MWRVVNASAAGTSHAANGKTCEDWSHAGVMTRPGGQPLLIVFVSDGAGSARHGGRGAELAVGAAAEFVAGRCGRPSFAPDAACAQRCVRAARQKIADAARRKKAGAGDYACTLLGVVATPAATLLMQIGDGGIVVDTGNGLEIPIAPMSGEYANMTRFVTDEDAPDLLAARVIPARADKVGVFTDGIQRLAMNMDTHAAHGPFFANFFKVLANAPKEREGEFRRELKHFLAGPDVNGRTDDDKTLVLAHWVGQGGR